MIFKFEKPIYGSMFSIWDKWLKIAKSHDMTIVAVTPYGKATYKVKDWIEGAEKIEKEYNIPGVPMVMYARHVLPDIKERVERKKVEARVDGVMDGLFTSMPEKYREAILKKLKAS